MTLPAVQELRALDVFDLIPEGFETVAVECGRNWPHLRPGEAAVFDPSQRTPIHGELFVFEYRSGRRSISSTEARLHKHVVQPDRSTAEEVLWWTCPLNRPSLYGETVEDWLAQGKPLFMADGPASAEVIGSNIIGRVVGIYMGRPA